MNAIGHYPTPAHKARFDAAYDAGMATLPPPQETHDVPTTYGTVRVYRFGTEPGEPLVLLHGRCGTTVMWEPNITELVRHRTVYSIDLLGEAGRSEQTASITDSADHASWLTQTLTHLDLAPAHMVGASFGGRLATDLAVHHPDKVATLSLLDPVQTFARFSVGLLGRTVLLSLPGIGPRYQPRFHDWIHQGEEVPEDHPALRTIMAAQSEFTLTLPYPVYLTDEQIRGLTMPVLVAIAGRSVMHHPKRAHRRALDLLPNARVELWPDALHGLAAQDPARADRAILEFVTGAENRS